MKAENIALVFVTTDYKKRAFHYGISLARKFGSKITLLNILYREPPTFGFFETKGDKRRQESKKKKAEKALMSMAQEAKKSGISVKTRVVFSDPISKGVISYVNERDFDLVVLDHPKLTQFEESYFGNTVCELHKGLNCPLLLLK